MSRSGLIRACVAAVLGTIPGLALIWLTGMYAFVGLVVCGAALGVCCTLPDMSLGKVLRMMAALLASRAAPSFMAEDVYQAVMNDDPANSDQNVERLPTASQDQLATGDPKSQP